MMRLDEDESMISKKTPNFKKNIRLNVDDEESKMEDEEEEDEEEEQTIEHNAKP